MIIGLGVGLAWSADKGSGDASPRMTEQEAVNYLRWAYQADFPDEAIDTLSDLVKSNGLMIYEMWDWLDGARKDGGLSDDEAALVLKLMASSGRPEAVESLVNLAMADAEYGAWLKRCFDEDWEQGNPFLLAYHAFDFETSVEIEDLVSAWVVQNAEKDGGYELWAEAVAEYGEDQAIDEMVERDPVLARLGGEVPPRLFNALERSVMIR
jgi:hypothetical protein